MTWSSEFVELDKKVHDRNPFDCGEPELNTFIQTLAAKHMAAGVSRTMVLPADKALAGELVPICAFYTITPSEIERRTLPKTLAKKLPFYPVPVFLLARLAVDLDFHGQGLGKIALVNALERLWKINAEMRAYAVIVDCLNDNARTFYERYGFQVLCNHNGRQRLFIPMKTLEQLFK